MQASLQDVTIRYFPFHFNKRKQFSLSGFRHSRAPARAATPATDKPPGNTLGDDVPPYLLPVPVCVPAGPEEVRTGAHCSALVGLLQKFGCGKSTLSPQGLMVLFTEALHPLEGADDQGDGSQLGFGVTDFIFIQRKRLGGHKAERTFRCQPPPQAFSKAVPRTPPPVRRPAGPFTSEHGPLGEAQDRADTVKMLTSCNKETHLDVFNTGSPN